MRQSLFNVRVPLPEDAGVFIMNTFTDAQAIVPHETAALLDRLPALHHLSADDRDALRELSEHGFVVEDHVRERDGVEAHFRDLQRSTDLLRVTVLTTLQCNFACDYCYQGDHGHPAGHPTAQTTRGGDPAVDWNKSAEKMSLETAARVADWMERRLDEVQPKTFSICFFGGEPLLNLPVLYYLSERMSAATEVRGVEMSITIVTNGLLLTREIVRRLRPYGLAGVKVTLDGDRETHNRMRPLRGGQGTFDRIINNVRQVADICAVSIGGNFDEKSIDSYPALLEYLRQQEFGDRLAKVAFKPIIRDKGAAAKSSGLIPLTAVDATGAPLNGTCMSVAGSGGASACDACNLLDDKTAWLREETTRRGFPTVDGVHMGPCEIHREHAHTIGPDGSLYACPGFTGDKAQSVGHIDGRKDPARARAASAFERLSAWKECHDCAFIPVCAGGCTVAAYAELGDINKPNCHKRIFEAGVAALARDAAASVLTPVLVA